MKKLSCLIILALLAGCKGKVQDSYFTPEKALSSFRAVEAICKKDSGKLWGRNLYGPIMFVDRTTRRITANQPDSEGILKLRDSVYTGLYPTEKVITNSGISFGGTLFGLAPLPSEEDNYRIITRAIHCLFHRYQQTIGINSENFNVPVMDEKQARIWMKLEWKALKKAINSENSEQLLAIRDALIFRGSNRESYPKYANMENQFEAYEGLATYTYIFLTAKSPEDIKSRLFEYLDRIYAYQSYSTSYGAIDGALYATLLHAKHFNFSTLNTDKIDLGKQVQEIYQVELPASCRDVAGSIAINYSIDEIYKEEEKRLDDIRKRIDEQVSGFTEKPVINLALESPYFDFEPEDVHYLDTLGTLYNRIRVSDNWGKLTVDKGGCLISNNYKNLRITARGLKVDKNHIQGEGWHLILNDSWEVREEYPDYYIRKMGL
ncbi:MAG: hypothetical protein Q8868_00340 [Bacteroidota bacterium]|nr:hypothetical protein [Bacteroidota bacterium]